MNINSLDRFIQQTLSRTADSIKTRSQSDIAASIGSSKMQQAEKARLAQQIQDTLQQRQANAGSRPAPKQVKDNSYNFSIYV